MGIRREMSSFQVQASHLLHALAEMHSIVVTLASTNASEDLANWTDSVDKFAEQDRSVAHLVATMRERYDPQRGARFKGIESLKFKFTALWLAEAWDGLHLAGSALIDTAVLVDDELASVAAFIDSCMDWYEGHAEIAAGTMVAPLHDVVAIVNRYTSDADGFVKAFDELREWFKQIDNEIKEFVRHQARENDGEI